MPNILALGDASLTDGLTRVVAGRYTVRPMDGLQGPELKGANVLIWPNGDARAARISAYLYAKCEAASVKILDLEDAAFDPAWSWEEFAAFAKPRARVYELADGVNEFEIPSAEDSPESCQRTDSSGPQNPHPAGSGATLSDSSGAPGASTGSSPRAPPPERPRPGATLRSPSPATRRPKADGRERAPNDIAPIGFFAWEGRPWAAHLLTTDKGSPKPLVANAIKALELDPQWAAVLGYDVFADRIVALKPPPVESPAGLWTDAHDIRVAEWLQRVGIQVSPMIAMQAVLTVAKLAPFHPVIEYLEACEAGWDHTERSEMWLCDFLGARDTPYTREIARTFLVGAVTRMFRPGCKLDTVLVLEGPQGTFKSTAFSILGGEWFSDDVQDFDRETDVAMQAACSWIIELSELSALSRAEVERVKAFLSRKIDKFRPPYGRHVVEKPRHCAFVGSTNNAEYLKDDENRRFLPIKMGEANLDGLAAARDQLWGEAVSLYRAGAKWWTDAPELVRTARQQQELRRSTDEWEGIVVAWLANTKGIVGDAPGETSVAEVLKDALNIPAERWNQVEQNRVARILRRLKFERYQRREGAQRIPGYRRLAVEPITVDVGDD